MDTVLRPAFDCHSEPFAVILSPSLVILSGAKNLALPLRVNSARNLALSVFNARRDSSSPAARPENLGVRMVGVVREPPLLESHVIPAKAGIHLPPDPQWAPAFARATSQVIFIRSGGPQAHGRSKRHSPSRGGSGVVPRLRCYWTVPWGSLYWLRHWPGQALSRAIQFRVYVSFLREWQPD